MSHGISRPLTNVEDLMVGVLFEAVGEAVGAGDVAGEDDVVGDGVGEALPSSPEQPAAIRPTAMSKEKARVIRLLFISGWSGFG